MTTKAKWTRRDFLGFAGAGLFVLVHAERASTQVPSPGPGGSFGFGGAAPDFNAYLKIGADGRVTGFTGKVEIGQGGMTSLAQVLAEELDVPFDSVDMVMGDTDLCPWDMGTVGQFTTPMFVPTFRSAGAEARAALLQMAAERFQVPVERLRVKDGVIRDSATPANSISYGQLVEGKRIERRVRETSVKAVSSFAVIGQSPRRKDALDKVTGRAKYAADMVFPDMLYASILRPPAHGAKLKSVDTSAAEKVTGVRVVKEGGLIAVLHPRPDVAADALLKVKAEFDQPSVLPDDKTIYDHLPKAAPRPERVEAKGDLAEGRRLAASAFDHTYLNPYLAHAPIETHAATAIVEDGKVTVWASTQSPFTAKDELVQALRLPAAKVRVVSRYVGAGFGGKSLTGCNAQATEAARLAMITGKPVQVMWSREEEFFYDQFRPVAVIKIQSGLGGAGKIAFWDAQIFGAGADEAKLFYDIPHHLTVSAGRWMGGNPAGMHPLAVGPWRGPSSPSNTFARESQVDIMAAKAGMDPLEFRLNNLSNPRMKRVLESAARKFDWKAGRGPSGRGVGVACTIHSRTYNATVAEVEVDKKTGGVKVKRVVIALDMGVVINPDGVRQQAEGGITMGLGDALSEEVRFQGGEVLDRSFNGYQIPRFSWVPKIETVLVDNPETTAVGVGEATISAVSAVVANAVCDATGVRIFRLPMTPERVKAALAQA